MLIYPTIYFEKFELELGNEVYQNAHFCVSGCWRWFGDFNFVICVIVVQIHKHENVRLFLNVL